MKNLLAREQRVVLEQLAWSRLLLGFDYDGTLAPIVRKPDRAALRASTRRLLAEVARHYPCVVISGRSLRDLEPRLEGVPLRTVIGNHGLEPWRATEGLRRTVAQWKERLNESLACLQGVQIEDKTYSLAVHYRASRKKREAQAKISKALSELGDVRVIGGKQVVNVLPVGAPHKGVALLRERDRLGCDTALFVGDDETDEDVFALEQPGRLLTVRISPSKTSQASYCLRSQAEIDSLLSRLIELRASLPSRRDEGRRQAR